MSGLLKQRAPRGLLVIGDSLAEQWYLGLACVIHSISPRAGNETPSLDILRAGGELLAPAGCHSSGAGLWSTQASFVARPTADDWELAFLRQDCPMMMPGRFVPGNLTLGKFDVVFLGLSFAHTDQCISFRDPMSNGTLQECELSDLIRQTTALLVDASQSIRPGGRLVVLGELPSHFPAGSKYANAYNDREAVSNSLSTNTAGCSREVERVTQVRVGRAALAAYQISSRRADIRVSLLDGIFAQYAQWPGAHVGGADCLHYCVPTIEALGVAMLRQILQVT